MKLNDAVADILAACRILEDRNLVEAFGHVSARLDAGLCAMTPARALGLVEEGDLLAFDIDSGEQVRGRTEMAPLEVHLHLGIYRARPDVGAICRTHSFHAVVLGSLGQPIRPAHGFGGMLGREVPLHDKSDLVVDAAAGAAAARSLGQAVAMLLRGNGALVTGRDVRQACVRAIYLEEAAHLQVSAAPLGMLRWLSEGELAARSRWYEAEVGRAWQYYSHRSSRPGHDRNDNGK